MSVRETASRVRKSGLIVGYGIYGCALNSCRKAGASIGQLLPSYSLDGFSLFAAEQ